MNIRDKKVVVTGGAGFIGSHLADVLLNAGNHVTVIDNFSSGSRTNLAHLAENPLVTVIEGDVRDRSLLADALRGVDVVYHLAVQCLRLSFKNPELVHDVNATGTLSVCMESVANSVRRFIYVSSSEVYGSAVSAPMPEEHPLEPTTVYGASKAAGELYALSCFRTYGLQSMVVRPFNTYGPRSHFEGASGEVIPKFVLRMLNDVPPVIFGDGEQTRDFTYVTDTARGIYAASACDELVGRAVNIARGEEVSINRLAALVAQALAKESLRPRHMDARPADVLRHFADTAKARDLAGFSAEIDIQHGVSLYCDWFRSQGYDLKALLAQDAVINWQ